MKKDVSYSYSSFFKNYGILLGFLAVILGILLYFTTVSQKSWVNNLRNSVNSVLNEKEVDSWVLGNYYKIKSPVSQNVVCYDARNKKNGEMYKTVMIKIQTFYGPLPAVFVVKDNEVNFMGYATLHGRVYNQIINNKSNKRINYWKAKIPEILEYAK